MSKYKEGNFIELYRIIFDLPDLSIKARWLYCVLTNLEHKYTGKGKKWFFRKDEELSLDSGLSERTIIRARQELVSAGLIRVGKAHYISNGRKSSFTVTTYEISDMPN